MIDTVLNHSKPFISLWLEISTAVSLEKSRTVYSVHQILRCLNKFSYRILALKRLRTGGNGTRSLSESDHASFNQNDPLYENYLGLGSVRRSKSFLSFELNLYKIFRSEQ